jgi:hypothetical protein
MSISVIAPYLNAKPMTALDGWLTRIGHAAGQSDEMTISGV